MTKIKRPRRGRPPQPRDMARRNRVTTFLTDDEFEKLERAAEETDKSLSAALYQLVTRALKRLK